MAKGTRTTKKPPADGGTSRTPRSTSRARTTQEPPDTPTNGGADREAIARRAYELYQARGGEHGYEIEDWLQAERELKTSRQGQR